MAYTVYFMGAWAILLLLGLAIYKAVIHEDIEDDDFGDAERSCALNFSRKQEDTDADPVE